MPSRGPSRLAATPAFPAAVFAVVLAAAVVATDVARATVPALQGRVPVIAQAERPADGDHYLANDEAGNIDQHVIYFGIDDEVVANLRAAEVLFLGHSRLMFALRPGVLRPFFAADAVPYYVMGFGFREADRFPLAIIRALDLRPRLVVVNADGFFGGGLSPWAEALIRDTPWFARKLQLEAEAAHDARRALHQLVPNWVRLFGLPGLGRRPTFIAYRSRADGTWDISPWADGTETFVAGALEGQELGRGEVAAARAFKAELDARGSTLVLTHVPTPEPLPGGGPARFAALLGVPLVAPDVPALTSHDHSHLSEGSAHDWSRAFLQALAPLEQASRGPDPGRR